MAKLENQARLVTALKAFMGERPSFYANETEFFLVSLRGLEEYLAELQKETLEEACANFLLKLDGGKVTPAVLGEFKAVIDRLVTPADFNTVSAGMAGSRELVRGRLSALKPVSLIAEAKKAGVRDPEALRNINGAYSRLGFDALAKKVAAAPCEASANAALSQAREEVADYCSLYRIQINASETLTPFSLSWVNAALAACFILYRAIRGSLCRGT